MTATAINLQTQTGDFSNRLEFFESLAKATGVIIDDQECEALQNVYEHVRSEDGNCGLTWQEFYEDGFIPAYHENFRQEMIRRGYKSCDPCAITSQEEAYEAGVKSLVGSMVGAPSDYELNAPVMAFPATLSAGLLATDCTGIFGGNHFFNYSLESKIMGSLVVGLTLLAGGLTLKGMRERYKRTSDANKILEAIKNDKPLMFNGYAVD